MNPVDQDLDRSHTLVPKKPPWESIWSNFDIHAEDYKTQINRRVHWANTAIQWLAREHRKDKAEVRKGWLVREDGEREPTLSDAGSNIDIITVSTAAYLESEYGIQFHEADSNHASYVMFGKEEAKSLICGWVYGAGLLDKVAVVKDVTANLISVKSFCQRGMTVVYDQELVSIRYQDKVIFQGRYDEEIKLWTFDIVHLMLAESPIEVEANRINNQQDSAQTYHSRARIKRHPAKSIRKAMELHQNLRHVPFSTMADNIESGAWDNLDADITVE